MSLLTIIGDAAKRIGLSPPSTVINSTDPNAVSLLAAAQQEGKTLARRHEWQVLQTEYTFPTADGTASYALPTGFARILKETVFNRTQRRRMVGDLTPQQWQETQASLVTMVNPAFRIRGNLFLISPTPSAVETIAYEYITKYWCESAGGTDQSSWLADTDTGILDEDLMTLGIIWRYKAGKSLEYAEDMQTYEMEVAKAILNDGARTRIDTSGVERDRIPHAPQMPESFTL
jgi:hypothetical protein